MNIIVICSDTLRRDRLGCYGCDWIVTPNIDRLASKSTVFDEYFLASFPTIPNRIDTFTGRYTFAYQGWGPLPRELPVLAQILGEAGYVTQLVTDVPHLVDRGRYFDRGFQGWEWIRGQALDRYMTLANKDIKLADSDLYRGEGWETVQHMRNVIRRKDEGDYSVAQTMRRACQWLENNYRAEKFFLWVDTFDPHEPWDPPKYYVDMYDPDYSGRVVTYPDYRQIDCLTTRELEHCHALYCGEVTLVDRWVGYLLVEIENLGLMDNTCIIFTTDHGFYHGEHGKIGKHTLTKKPWALYEEVCHIPLVVYLPGIKSGRCNVLSQPPDILPTILDLCNIQKPNTIQGESLSPALHGESRPLREIAVCTAALRFNEIQKGEIITVKTKISLTDGKWSLVFGGKERKELYNLERDPKQKQSVMQGNESLIEDLYRKGLEVLRFINAPPESMAKMQSEYSQSRD